MIELQDVRFEYPSSTFRLEIEHLAVERGQRVAVVGPSGCGKTTLLNLLAGISLPSAGQITVDGCLVSKLPDSQRRDFRSSRVGQVFQQFELVEYLSLAENIQLPFLVNRNLQRISRGDLQQRALQLATSMGLADKLHRTPHRLSQGERQRVAICRALVNHPPLILADEPTGNLDPANKQNSLHYLLKYCDDHQATLVVVTHDTGILDEFSRVIDFQQLLHKS